MERDAVVSLALADILDEIVLHSGLEAGGEGHGGGQLLEHGHFAAGQGEGGGQVHQEHEGGKHRRHAPGGGADPPPQPPAAGPGPGAGHGALQGGGQLLRCVPEGLVFFHAVHGSNLLGQMQL